MPPIVGYAMMRNLASMPNVDGAAPVGLRRRKPEETRGRFSAHVGHRAEALPETWQAALPPMGVRPWGGVRAGQRPSGRLHGRRPISAGGGTEGGPPLSSRCLPPTRYVKSLWEATISARHACAIHLDFIFFLFVGTPRGEVWVMPPRRFSLPPGRCALRPTCAGDSLSPCGLAETFVACQTALGERVAENAVRLQQCTLRLSGCDASSRRHRVRVAVHRRFQNQANQCVWCALSSTR